MSIAVAVAALAVALAAMFWLFGSIHYERVPETVWPFQLALGMSAVASLGAAAGAPSATTVGLALLSLSTGGLLLFLLGIRRTPPGALSAHLGAALPPLQAVDHEGRPYDLASLAGQRVLLKFFRGHW